jgi:DNA repair photolyase
MATKELKTKSVLSVYRNKDPLYGFRYVADPYLGCANYCAYCSCSGREDVIKDEIMIQVNAGEVLSRQLAKRPREIVGVGRFCDPYMPLEKHYLITHDILQVLAVQGFPVHIITKSTLVLRDRKLLQEIDDKSKAAVTFNFAAPTLELAKRLEPNSSTPIKRFKAIHTLASKGITCGISLNPVLPFLGDYQRGIKQLILAARESGASYVLAAPLVLREKQGNEYYSFLEENHPELLQPYRILYGRGSSVPSSYWEPISEMIKALTHEQGMAYEPPYWCEMQKKQLSLF